jgi:hypothetical protein
MVFAGHRVVTGVRIYEKAIGSSMRQPNGKASVTLGMSGTRREDLAGGNFSAEGVRD